MKTHQARRDYVFALLAFSPQAPCARPLRVLPRAARGGAREGRPRHSKILLSYRVAVPAWDFRLSVPWDVLAGFNKMKSVMDRPPPTERNLDSVRTTGVSIRTQRFIHTTQLL